MIENKLIIIPLGLPWNWPADYEKKTALQLSGKNIVIPILFNEGLTLKNYLISLFGPKKSIFLYKYKKLFLFKPLYFIPFQRIKIIRNINYSLSVLILKFFIFCKKRFREKKKVLWIFTSSINFASFFTDNCFVIYDCVDLVTSVNAEIKNKKIEKETELIKRTDAIFTTSRFLSEYHRKKFLKTYYVSQGVDIELLLRNNNYHCPKDLEKIPTPRIGFVGNINYRLDYNFIIKLAKITPDYSYIFIGPEVPVDNDNPLLNTQKNIEKLKKLKNIYFLGEKQKADISKYISFLNFGFIPYKKNLQFNKYSYPMKLLEYFYFKKPVISTRIIEFINLVPYVVITDSHFEAKLALEKIIKNGWPKKHQQYQYKFAINHSWKSKLEKIEKTLKNEYPHFFDRIASYE